MVPQPFSDDLESPSRRLALRGLAEGLAIATLGGLSSEALARDATPVLASATSAIVPFRVHVPQGAIDDLKRRLTTARLPERETVADWSQGVPLDKAKALIAYWRDRYDWRRFERLSDPFVLPGRVRIGSVTWHVQTRPHLTQE